MANTGRRGSGANSEDRPGGRNYKVLARLIGFVVPYKGRLAAALIMLTLAAGTVLAFGAGLRWLVDNGFATGDAGLLDQALVGMLGIVAVLALSTFGRAYMVAWLGERVAADIRKAVFSNVLRLSPAFFEATRTGEVMSRLTNDTTLLQTIVGSSVSMALRNVMMSAGGIVMMAVMSPKLTGLVLLVVPLVVFPIIFIGRFVRRLSRASQDRIGDVSARLEETLAAIRTVQAFGHEDIDRGRFAGDTENAFAAAVRRSVARASLAGIVILLVFVAVGTILWIGGHDVLLGNITGGELSAFIFFAVVVAGSVGAISEFASDLQQAAGASERLFELLDTQPQIAPPASPLPLPSPVRGEVVFQNVNFHYPSRPPEPDSKDGIALSDFSLTVPSGKTVALVGPSGAGKTTVFQLLLRFYDPQSGSVMLDGVDLRRADPGVLRAQIGLVPQDPVIFAADAWENIRYGRPGATDEEVRQAADAAAATEFLDRLPQGFGTFLGERGVRLSGGQRQRVAIARAVLRNPAVLLLDEATSSLDAESERLIQQALERLMSERTVIVIAHRLATVLRADRIAVLDRGRLVAQGTHAELSAQGGLYARLAALQFNAAADLAAGRARAVS